MPIIEKSGANGGVNRPIHQNRPKLFPNNEKQLSPKKMSKRTHFRRNPLIRNSLQEVNFRQVYVKPISRNSLGFGKISNIGKRSQFAETCYRIKHYMEFCQTELFQADEGVCRA